MGFAKGATCPSSIQCGSSWGADCPSISYKRFPKRCLSARFSWYSLLALFYLLCWGSFHFASVFVLNCLMITLFWSRPCVLNIDVATLLALFMLWVDKDICRRRLIIFLSNIQPPVHWVACDCIIAISLMKFWTTWLSCNHFCLGFLDSHASTMCVTAVMYRAYWRSRWGADR